MAKTDLSIPSLGNKFVDIRDTIPGDSYNWSWVRPLSQVNYLAIHASGGADTETAQDIANAHINKNGWGGIGYHFLIGNDGTVFYVGDISTARANVANLNEQVIGIGLIGNFTQGQVPTNEQIDSCHKLCEFFIGYPPLSNVNSWDKLRGHKELPGQSTTCPGDNWSALRIQIVEGVNLTSESAAGIVFSSPAPAVLEKDQINNLQASLALVNQQLISLKEVLAEREQEVSRLKSLTPRVPAIPAEPMPKIDTTLTLTGAMVNLYTFLFPPGNRYES